MTPTLTTTATSADAVEDDGLLTVVRELQAWLIAIVIVCTAVAIAVAFLMRPVYRAEAVLLPVTQEGDLNMLASMATQLGALGSLAGIDVGGDGLKESAIATMRSRSFSAAFIEDKQLVTLIFEDVWDAEAGKWTVDPDDVPTLWEAQKVFDEDIRSITENRRTGLVTVAVEWRDPQEAATWVNELVTRANKRIRDQVIQESEKSLAYLNKELEKTQAVELRQAIFKLAENQTRKIMIANVRDDYAFQVIDPAAPPDEDDYVRPQRVVLILAGLLAGLALALAVVLVTASLRRSARG